MLLWLGIRSLGNRMRGPPERIVRFERQKNIDRIQRFVAREFLKTSAYRSGHVPDGVIWLVHKTLQLQCEHTKEMKR